MSSENTGHWRQSSKLIPNYEKMPLQLFKQLLSKALPNYYREIQQISANTEMLQHIQLRAQITCNIFKLEIEQTYWNKLTNTNIPIMSWLSQMSKDFIQRHSINWDHTKTKTNIKHRQKIIKNKLKQLEKDFHISLHRYVSESETEIKWCLENSLCLIEAINDIVQKGLDNFRINLEHKLITFEYDMHDAQIVKLFYDLNPTVEQIRSVQQIWQTKSNSYNRAIIEKKNHSSIIDQGTLQDNNNNDHYQQTQSPSMEVFTPAMRMIIKSRLTNIEKCAKKIMQFSNASS